MWLFDRFVEGIGLELRDDLGHWHRHRMKSVEAAEEEAKAELKKCATPVPLLREEWAHQKVAYPKNTLCKYRSSQRRPSLISFPDTPVKLRKELDKVLKLQSELATVARSITTTRKALKRASQNRNSRTILKELRATHGVLQERVQALYMSLNIDQSFPTLTGVNLEFVHALLMARDLKIRIRAKVIGTLHQWNRLDQAAGGRAQALGEYLSRHLRTLTTYSQERNCTKLLAQASPSENLR